MTDKPTRRVRANSPPPEEDPIQFWIPNPPSPQDDSGDLVDFLLALAIILAFIAIFLVGVGLI
jgi:hypothetical protein